MSVIDFDSFMKFCKGLEGQKLRTVGNRAWFTLRSVENDELHYIVGPLQNKRSSGTRYIERVLQCYSKSKSLRPKDYIFTFRAPYVLALLKLYVDSQEKLEDTGRIPQKGMSCDELVEQVRELLRRYDENG